MPDRGIISAGMVQGRVSPIVDACDLSGVDVSVDIIEIAHKGGVTPYLDRVRIRFTDGSANPDSVVLHIGGRVNIDVTDYETEPKGILLFNSFGNNRNVEFNPMDDRMILSMVSRGKDGSTTCVKNIYP